MWAANQPKENPPTSDKSTWCSPCTAACGAESSVTELLEAATEGVVGIFRRPAASPGCPSTCFQRTNSEVSLLTDDEEMERRLMDDLVGCRWIAVCGRL